MGRERGGGANDPHRAHTGAAVRRPLARLEMPASSCPDAPTPPTWRGSVHRAHTGAAARRGNAVRHISVPLYPASLAST